MTDIEKMAREAGVIDDLLFPRPSNEKIERFAQAVARRCAEVAKELCAYTGGHGEPSRPGGEQIAAAIRAEFEIKDEP